MRTVQKLNENRSHWVAKLKFYFIESKVIKKESIKTVLEGDFVNYMI